MDYFKRRLIRKFINKYIFKILFILLIFFICMFLYGAFHLVFGYVSFDYNNQTYTFPDLPQDLPYYCYYYNVDTGGGNPVRFILVMSDEPIRRCKYE